MTEDGTVLIRRRWPRLANLALGLWLVFSTFAWGVDSSSAFTTLMFGVFIAACAVLALWAPWFRYANTFFGVSLLAFALMFRHASAFRAWNSRLVAIAVVVLSLVPTPGRLTTGPDAVA